MARRGSMTAQFTFDGLDEVRAALKSAPEALRRELVPEVNALVESLASEVTSAYPIGPTGNLRKGVRLTRVADAAGLLVGRVATTAPHSRIYEGGTVPRQNKRRANRGVMPAANIFIPAAIRHRARLEEVARRALAAFRIPGFENDGEVAA